MNFITYKCAMEAMTSILNIAYNSCDISSEVKLFKISINCEVNFPVVLHTQTIKSDPAMNAIDLFPWYLMAFLPTSANGTFCSLECYIHHGKATKKES